MANKTIELNVKQRILLAEILPNEGQWVDMLHIKDLTEKISITAKEASVVGLKQELNEGGGVFYSWDTTKESIKKLEPNKEQVAIVLGLFPELKSATLDHVFIYEKFKFYKK